MKISDEVTTYSLRPAELCFVSEPALIRTVLGSCITITMYNKRTGTAAACHPVLPICLYERLCEPEKCCQKYKYVECVIPEMIKQFQEVGAKPSELEIKMFGGGYLCSSNATSNNTSNVGETNIAMARQKIEELEVTIKSYNVGGPHGRKILFDTGTGDVWVKRFKIESANRADKILIDDQQKMLLEESVR